MKPPEQTISRTLVLTFKIGLCILGAATVALFLLHRQNAAEIDELRRLAGATSQQVEQGGKAFAQLRAASQTNNGIQEAEAGAWNAKRRLTEMGMPQTQTLSLDKGVADKTEGSVQQSEAYRKASLVALEEEQDKLRMRCHELLISLFALEDELKIPDSIAAIATDQALRTPSMRKYQEYFALRRERELLEPVLERLKVRLIQEHMEDNIRAKMAKSILK